MRDILIGIDALLATYPWLLAVVTIVTFLLGGVILSTRLRVRLKTILLLQGGLGTITAIYLYTATYLIKVGWL